jgi:hypothetical protein
VISDALQSWSIDVAELAAKARVLKDTNDRAAVRVGLEEIAVSLEDLAAVLGPGVS